MSEQLYEVRFALDPDALPWRMRVLNWLRRNNCEQHFVNGYWNDEHGSADVIIVLTDRTTAIMLKLALS